MAAQNEIKAPDWVFPGAQVVTYYRRNGNVSQVQPDTVKSVGKIWITLENLDLRISKRKLETVNQSHSNYGISVYCMVERYSEQGQKLLTEDRINRATGAVTAAFEVWQKNPRDETARSDFRAALDRLDNAIDEE